MPELAAAVTPIIKLLVVVLIFEWEPHGLHLLFYLSPEGDYLILLSLTSLD